LTFPSFDRLPSIHAGWNLLDVFVVVASLLSLGNSFLNLNVIRMLRAVRAIRIFGRVDALKKVAWF
jgi:hypothetical protein